MKRFLNAALALTLAFVMAFLGTAQVFADAKPEYVGEVKVATGGSAQKDLEDEGFTVLCDEKGNPVDLIQGAGGGIGSKGDKKVFLGYKTTTEVTEAITDLALMNM